MYFMPESNFDNIHAFFFRIECILTDGHSFPNESGRSGFMINEKDTFALRMAKMNGYPIGLYSEDFPRDQVIFFKRYGIEESDIMIPCKNRLEALERFASQHNLSPQCVLFAGSDIPDIPFIGIAGAVASPCDASDEIKMQSNYVSSYEGGHLFVRDIIEKVLKSQGRWIFDPVVYAKMF